MIRNESGHASSEGEWGEALFLCVAFRLSRGHSLKVVLHGGGRHPLASLRCAFVYELS